MQITEIESKFLEVVLKVLQECQRAREKHGPFRSQHELYGVLMEEVEEWWESVKADEPDNAELISIAAMAVLGVIELKGKCINDNYILKSSEQIEETEPPLDSES